MALDNVDIQNLYSGCKIIKLVHIITLLRRKECAALISEVREEECLLFGKCQK